MSKHTPGPWKLWPGRENKSPIVCIGEGIGLKGIAEVMGHGEETTANAALIAAAPDLLAALQDLTNCFWEGRPKRNVKHDYHLMVRFEAAKKALRKAQPTSAD